MNDKNTQIVTTTPGLFDRVIASPTARNGIATAAAAVIIATITEVIWPSQS
jgi:hypothetical protein